MDRRLVFLVGQARSDIVASRTHQISRLLRVPANGAIWPFAAVAAFATNSLATNVQG